MSRLASGCKENKGGYYQDTHYLANANHEELKCEDVSSVSKNLYADVFGFASQWKGANTASQLCFENWIRKEFLSVKSKFLIKEKFPF